MKDENSWLISVVSIPTTTRGCAHLIRIFPELIVIFGYNFVFILLLVVMAFCVQNKGL